MSSSVCQGLQSCLEPRQVEQPLVLRLKLAPPKSNFSHSSALSNNRPNTENNGNKKSNFHDSENKNNNNGELGGWSFIQALTNTPQTSKKSPEKDADDEKVYVHPLAKRSASMLSEKSLEMCTENLGSETGSDISESMDDNYSYLSDNADFSPKSYSKNRGTSWESPKKTCSRVGGSFPPPLTSIRGTGSFVRVEPHREGGRLVLKAVSVSSSKTLFHAERGNGRLRLHFLKENSGDSDIKAAAAKEREEAIDDDDDDDDDGDVEEIEEDGVDVEAEDETDVEELEEDGIDVEAEDETEEEEQECDDSVCWDEDMDGNSENVGGEIEIKKFQKPSRCKEGGHRNKGLWNLEAYWVATS